MGTAVETQQVQKYDQGCKSWYSTPGHLRILKTKEMALQDGGFCRCHLCSSSGCQAPWYAVKLIILKGYISIVKDCMARCPAGFNCNRTPLLSYCIMYYACLMHPATLLLNVHKYDMVSTLSIVLEPVFSFLHGFVFHSPAVFTCFFVQPVALATSLPVWLVLYSKLLVSGMTVPGSQTAAYK